jgi:hypothetical protein
VKRPAVVLCALSMLALAPATSHAATCSDYPDQASAQRAKDTRDADGDGLYCEDNPCPCLGVGGSGSGRHRTARLPTYAQMGDSHLLGRRSKHRGCELNGALPDRACTPGAVFRKATRRLVCRDGYSAKVRHVTSAKEERVYAEYGIRHHVPGQYEVDHLVPLELGGSNAIANLFPQPAVPDPPGLGFPDKDRLENAMHDDVCDQVYGLSRAQRAIAADWLVAYSDYVGDA